MNESKARWLNASIPLGDQDIATLRRRAYWQAAGLAGKSSFAGWAREILDKAAKFVPQAKSHD